jgi:hypothetical protein
MSVFEALARMRAGTLKQATAAAAPVTTAAAAAPANADSVAAQKAADFGAAAAAGGPGGGGDAGLDLAALVTTNDGSSAGRAAVTSTYDGFGAGAFDDAQGANTTRRLRQNPHRIGGAFLATDEATPTGTPEYAPPLPTGSATAAGGGAALAPFASSAATGGVDDTALHYHVDGAFSDAAAAAGAAPGGGIFDDLFAAVPGDAAIGNSGVMGDGGPAGDFVDGVHETNAMVGATGSNGVILDDDSDLLAMLGAGGTLGDAAPAGDFPASHYSHAVHDALLPPTATASSNNEFSRDDTISPLAGVSAAVAARVASVPQHEGRQGDAAEFPSLPQGDQAFTTEAGAVDDRSRPHGPIDDNDLLGLAGDDPF